MEQCNIVVRPLAELVMLRVTLVSVCSWSFKKKGKSGEVAGVTLLGELKVVELKAHL